MRLRRIGCRVLEDHEGDLFAGVRSFAIAELIFVDG